MTVSLHQCAPKLELSLEGWWVSPTVSEVSYPESGNALCFAVEESSFWFEHRNQCILAAIRLFPPAGAVFDVGGGNGFVARAIQEAGFDVVLLEPGLQGVRNALKRGIRLVVRSTLEDAGVVAATLPAVGLFDVIEHIRDDRHFLLRVRTLMTPGGRIYITVPAHRFLWSGEDVLAGHLRRYTLHDLSDVLERAGYSIDYASYFFSFLPIPIFIRRVLPFRLGRSPNKMSEAAVRADHEVERGLAANLLRIATRRELRKIAQGRSLKHGASCLVVARKR